MVQNSSTCIDFDSFGFVGEVSSRAAYKHAHFQHRSPPQMLNLVQFDQDQIVTR